MSIDSWINDKFGPVADAFEGFVFTKVPVPFIEGVDILLILVWLAAAGVILTIYFGFPNIRYFPLAIKLLRGDDVKKSDKGSISRFKALATSVSGTVGLGNIAGVAVAISVGGPGAAFWMVIMGVIGMSVKLCEVTLSVKYRQFNDEDDPSEISGGPMYYLEHGVGKIKGINLGKILGVTYAALIMLGAVGAASLFQTNQVFEQVVNITGGAEVSYFADKGWIIGLIMVVMVAAVIIGGIKSIARVTSKLVPLMCGIYLLAGLVVLIVFYAQIPAAIVTIVGSALSFKAGVGAFMGALIMGIQRASFSNESGLGTASIAHSAAQTNVPVTQGLVAMIEPFIDTIIVCTMTALVITVTGSYEVSEGIEGVTLTSRAFEAAIPWFSYVLFVVVFLFAYSTLITWSYYGVKGFGYLFGVNNVTENIYKLIFCLFIIVGASADLGKVIAFTDASVFAMAIPNIIGLYILAPEVKKALKTYVGKLSTS